MLVLILLMSTVGCAANNPSFYPLEDEPQSDQAWVFGDPTSTDADTDVSDAPAPEYTTVTVNIPNVITSPTDMYHVFLSRSEILY